MSRTPHKEGVGKVRDALKEFRFLVGRAAELRKAAGQLPGVEEQAKKKHQEVIKLMEEMDVKSNGNFGWENRIMWFLDELDKQAGSDPS